MTPPRIVSLLPSATEMVFALGLGDALVAVSHECDYPEAARTKPQVVRNRLPSDGITSAEIDKRVAATIGGGESIYTLDLDRLKEAKPDLILTQQLCDVCAVTGTDLEKVLKTLKLTPQVQEQTPTDIRGIFDDILRLGELLNVAPRAQQVVEKLQERLLKLRAATKDLPKPRVYCMEWLDPPYACGHWVPEQAEFAGAADALGKTGAPSRRIGWDDVRQADPDVIVLMPCGFTVEKTRAMLSEISSRSEWKDLRAVRDGKIWLTDANAYFSRPGPRVVDGAELLGHLFHSKEVKWSGDPDAFAPLSAR